MLLKNSRMRGILGPIGKFQASISAGQQEIPADDEHADQGDDGDRVEQVCNWKIFVVGFHETVVWAPVVKVLIS